MGIQFVGIRAIRVKEFFDCSVRVRKVVSLLRSATALQDTGARIQARFVLKLFHRADFAVGFVVNNFESPD